MVSNTGSRDTDAADNFNNWVAGSNTHFENKDLAFSFQEMPPVLSTIYFSSALPSLTQ